MFYSEIEENLTARRLVLSLLNVSGKAQETIAHLVAAGQLFGIEDSSIRMAVGRLMKEGLLVSVRRGRYEIGGRGTAMREELRGWQNALDRTKPWDGTWLAVMTSHLGRTNRKSLRNRERALKLSGLVEVVAGIWIRPANLMDSISDLRTRLVMLGLDENAVIGHVSAFESDTKFDPKQLWAADDYVTRYKEAINAMSDSTANIPNMTPAQSARETLLVGQTVLHIINLDPLLPNEIIDQSLLEQMINDMRAYNQLGLECWQKFYAQVDMSQPA